MDALFFIVKYIPFWALCSIFVLGPFVLIYRKREFFRVAKRMTIYLVFCLFCLIFWVWSGGGDGSVAAFKKLIGY